MTAWWKQWSDKLIRIGRDKAVRWLAIAGVAGMVLIALTEWLPRREDAASATAAVSAAQVEQAMEQRITALLEEVAGVGKCRVMVTLECDEQAVYAADTTHNDTGATLSESYLTVDTADGPVGLLLTRIRPTVRGVAVVCRGAEDPAVCQRVQAVIATAFHISERRVCVVQQK